VMTITSLNSQSPVCSIYRQTAIVAGKWINAHGGIHMHSLSVTVCDDQGESTQACACARQAVLRSSARAQASRTPTGVYVMGRRRREMSLTASDALACISVIEQSHLSRSALPLPGVGRRQPRARLVRLTD
jgi:hypothetical protein